MTDAPGIADAAVLSFFIFSFSFSEFDALVSTACVHFLLPTQLLMHPLVAADVDAAWSCQINDASSLVAGCYLVAMSTLASAQTK